MAVHCGQRNACLYFLCQPYLLPLGAGPEADQGTEYAGHQEHYYSTTLYLTTHLTNPTLSASNAKQRNAKQSKHRTAPQTTLIKLVCFIEEAIGKRRRAPSPGNESKDHARIRSTDRQPAPCPCAQRVSTTTTTTSPRARLAIHLPTCLPPYLLAMFNGSRASRLARCAKASRSCTMAAMCSFDRASPQQSGADRTLLGSQASNPLESNRSTRAQRRHRCE
jgi:hypothetical protein